MANRAQWLAATSMTVTSLLVNGTVLARSPAQQSDASIALEEIVVTAQRRAENIQTVPIAVSALDAGTLEDLQITQTSDLQRVIPGLKLLPNVSSPTNLTLSLRGSTQQDASLVVAESPVGFYVDDIYIARLNGANAQLADLERIEVLRGPQGTLYGRNTLAGAVKFVTRTPGQELNADATAGFGNHGSYRVSGAVSGPLSDTLSASIAGLANGTSGFYRNIVLNEDVGRERNYAVRGKLRLDAGALDATASVAYAQGKNDAYIPVPAAVPATPQVRTGDFVPTFGNWTTAIAPLAAPLSIIETRPRGDTSQIIASLNIGYDLGWATVRSITGYVSTEDYFNVDFTGFGAFYGANGSDTEQWSQELQLQGNAVDDRLTYILGAYWFRETADQAVALVTVDSLAITTRSIALFAQGTFGITDRLSATAGLRWTQDKKAFDATIRPLLAPVNFDFSSRDTYRAVTPRFVVDYKVPGSDGGVLDAMLLYASVARGFKSGGYNGIAFGNPTTLSTVYRPETNWTYEAGAKIDLFDRRARLNLAYFINRIDDLALNSQATGPGGVSFPVQNAGDATIRGLELEATARPIEHLNLFANVTLQSGKYRRLDPGSTAAASALAFGSVKPPQVPDVAFTIGFDYGHDITIGGLDTRFKIGADLFHTSSFAVAVANDIIVDSYTRVNGFVGLALDETWEARVQVLNIANKATFFSGIRAFGGYSMLPPRQIMGTISYRY